MKLIPTALPGVVLVEPEVLADGRGWFAERFRQDVFEAGLRELGLPAPAPFVQENQSSSGLGVLRGLHYQLAPHAQGKLVSVVAGEIFDVAVDIRPGSPAFGQWLGVYAVRQSLRPRRATPCRGRPARAGWARSPTGPRP
jgi:dTDP-4-dehydrorhamnose 3,5-epimerase